MIRATAVHVEIAARPRSSGSSGNMHRCNQEAVRTSVPQYALRSRWRSKTAAKGPFRNPVMQARQQQPCAPKKLQRRRSGCLHRELASDARPRVDPIPGFAKDVGSARSCTEFHAGRLALQNDYRFVITTSGGAERRVLPDHHQDKPAAASACPCLAVVASSLSPIEAPMRAEHRST